MRTTLDLPEDLLEEARRLSGARTKRAALIAALESYVQEHRRPRLLDMLGKTKLNLTQEQLREMRHADAEPDPDAPLRLTLPPKGTPPWLCPKD